MKKKYRCINENWDDLFTIKLNSTPIKGEIIFNEIYYEIINVIHTTNNVILILKEFINENNP